MSHILSRQRETGQNTPQTATCNESQRHPIVSCASASTTTVIASLAPPSWLASRLAALDCLCSTCHSSCQVKTLTSLAQINLDHRSNSSSALLPKFIARWQPSTWGDPSFSRSMDESSIETLPGTSASAVLHGTIKSTRVASVKTSDARLSTLAQHAVLMRSANREAILRANASHSNKTWGSSLCCSAIHTWVCQGMSGISRGHKASRLSGRWIWGPRRPQR